MKSKTSHYISLSVQMPMFQLAEILTPTEGMQQEEMRTLLNATLH